MEKSDVYFAEDSAQMIDAYKKAQSTFRYFWREAWWERRRIVPALDLECVQAKFQQEQASGLPIVEYMWLDDISFDGIHVKGSLINRPEQLTNIKEGDIVEIPLSQISDWLFAIHKRTYGGFTIQVLRAGMGKKERKEHDKAWGLDFGDPDKIQIAYEEDKHPENLVEHPMSINMGKSLEAFLTQHPEELTQKDECGYTMLHREAIAGNRTCIEILLQMGADITAKTDSGYTAFDFAKELKWDHLIPILQQL